MREWVVSWQIEVDGRTAQEAAEEARRVQLDPNSIANVFSVTRPGALTQQIDLGLSPQRPPAQVKTLDPKELRVVIDGVGRIGFQSGSPDNIVALEMIFPGGVWMEDRDGRPTYVPGLAEEWRQKEQFTK